MRLDPVLHNHSLQVSVEPETEVSEKDGYYEGYYDQHARLPKRSAEP